MDFRQRGDSRRATRRRRSAAVGALVLTASFASSPAHAQTTAPPVGQDPSFMRARAAFERGMASMAAERFGEAIPALSESYRLRPTPIVQYNLGIALRSVGRYVDAIAAFERYLSSAGPSLTGAQRDAIEREVLTMQSNIGSVHIAVTPTIAAVSVDGRAQLGRHLTLDPGEHSIEATADGFVARRVLVTIVPGADQTTSLRLLPWHAAASTANGAGGTNGRPPFISPMIWFGIGGIVLGAGGAIALGLYGDARFDALQARCDAALCASTDASYRTMESQLGALAVGVYVLWGVAGVGAVFATVGSVLSARVNVSNGTRMVRRDGVRLAATGRGIGISW